MSTSLEEKLETPVRPDGTRARAKAHQLEARWGCKGLDAKKPPLFVLVKQMNGTTEYWKRIGGPGGKDTLYELAETQVAP